MAIKRKQPAADRESVQRAKKLEHRQFTKSYWRRKASYPPPESARLEIRSVDDILDLLCGVQNCGQGWLALCPAHCDQQASLSIGLGQDGRILLYCHAGCNIRAIAAALGLSQRDLFPPGRKPPPVGRREYSSADSAAIGCYPRFNPLSRQLQRNVKEKELRQLARDLGVAPKSLRRLHVGWASCAGAWGFPMYEVSGNVIGIRLRHLDGRKSAIGGSKQGLFIPDGIAGIDPLYVCEGPTDTAAMLDLGFAAIGRPSCSGGTPLVCEFVRVHRPTRVVIVADNDRPGIDGAQRLAGQLATVCDDVAVLLPPSKVKDVRDWKRGGATHRDVTKAVAQLKRLCSD